MHRNSKRSITACVAAAQAYFDPYQQQRSK